MNLTAIIDRWYRPPQVVPQNRVFSPEHFLLTGLILLFIIWLVHKVREKGDVTFTRQVVQQLGVIMGGLELFCICWRMHYYGWTVENLRFDWCNQICIVLPVLAVSLCERAWPFVDSAAFLGGGVVLAYPLWVFYDYARLHIMSIQSMVSHGLMVAIALLLPSASLGGYRRDPWKMGKRLAGLACLLAIAFLTSHWLNQNYLIMLNADGIPVLEHLAWPYYWVLALPLMMLNLFLTTLGLSHFDRWMARGVQKADSASSAALSSTGGSS